MAINEENIKICNFNLFLKIWGKSIRLVIQSVSQIPERDR